MLAAACDGRGARGDADGGLCARGIPWGSDPCPDGVPGPMDAAKRPQSTLGASRHVAKTTLAAPLAVNVDSATSMVANRTLAGAETPSVGLATNGLPDPAGSRPVAELSAHMGSLAGGRALLAPPSSSILAPPPPSTKRWRARTALRYGPDRRTTLVGLGAVRRPARKGAMLAGPSDFRVEPLA
jgi:hypothetical protein